MKFNRGLRCKKWCIYSFMHPRQQEISYNWHRKEIFVDDPRVQGLRKLWIKFCFFNPQANSMLWLLPNTTPFSFLCLTLILIIYNLVPSLLCNEVQLDKKKLFVKKIQAIILKLAVLARFASLRYKIEKMSHHTLLPYFCQHGYF